MTLLFNRAVQVDVTTTSFIYTFNSIRMDFDIELTCDPEPNTCSLTLHNLAKSTRDAIVSDGIGVTIRAGYGDSVAYGTLPLIYTGNITTTQNEKTRDGWRTVITSVDGGFSLLNPVREQRLKDAYFAKSYAAGTPIQKILLDIALLLAIPFELGYVPINNTIITGITFCERASDALTRLCNRLNLHWTICHGVLEVSDQSQPLLSAVSRLVLLAPDTGLIESPIITVDTDINTGKPVGSITCVSKLNANLLPKRPVRILPTFPMSFAGQRLTKQQDLGKYKVDANGTYIIYRSTFSGSNRADGPFTTQIECPLWQL